MKEIEWIKDMVKVCINNDLSENDKRNRFEELKMRYENFTLTERNLIKKTIKEQFEVNDQIYLYSVLLFYMANKNLQKVCWMLYYWVNLTLVQEVCWSCKREFMIKYSKTFIKRLGYFIEKILIDLMRT